MTDPAPFYEDDAVVIYHGDYREVIPRLDFAESLPDLLFLDPPFDQWDQVDGDLLRSVDAPTVLAFTRASPCGVHAIVSGVQCIFGVGCTDLARPAGL